jgi:tagatose 1,6-diphosphate aldolase
MGGMRVPWSLGKVRGLQQCADDRGVFTMVAMDQRASMAAMLDPQDPDAVPFQRLQEVKLELAATFSPLASAILIDVEYGLAAAVATGAVSGRAGLLVAVEETGYTLSGEGRLTRLLPGWGVQKVKRVGASAVKLLVYYHPDHADAAAHQRQVVQQVVEACATHDIPAVVEAVSYGLRSPAERPDVVVRTARHLVPLGVDLFKAEFPVDLRSDPDEGRAADWCRRLDEACGDTPWVILSAGVAMDLFRRQVDIACRNGASGFLAGRAIWQDSLRQPTPEERRAHLRTRGVENFLEVAAIAREHATPWTKKAGARLEALRALPADWYQNYGG